MTKAIEDQNARLLAPLYAIGGEEGFYLPAAAGLCLTRDGARDIAGEDNVDRDHTAIDPVIVLGIRMQTRLLELGLSVRDAALACNALVHDVNQMLEGNGVDEQVRVVKVSEFVDGKWTPTPVLRAAEWAELPLWPAQDARA